MKLSEGNIDVYFQSSRDGRTDGRAENRYVLAHSEQAQWNVVHDIGFGSMNKAVYTPRGRVGRNGKLTASSQVACPRLMI